MSIFIWIDDVRPAPAGYHWCKSVNETIQFIVESEMYKKSNPKYSVAMIDLDHDAGDSAEFGGDYIKILDWLEETHRNIPIRIHTQNPVGAENMRRIIRKNHWKEIL